MSRSQLEFAWRTDRGKVRVRNEDSVAVSEDAGVVVIADGIGGASAGDVASRLATDVIGDRLIGQPPSRVDSQSALLAARSAIKEADGAIHAHARQTPSCDGMGTTVVVGYFGDAWLAFAHVGDSRLYRLRNDELEQLTRDHSFIQEVVDQGFFPDLSEARHYGINQHVLTRAVGSETHSEPSSAATDLAAGDIYLFCTDGLSGMLSDKRLRRVLSSMADDLGATADSLVQLACEKGGRDNITLVLARVRSLSDNSGDIGQASNAVV